MSTYMAVGLTGAGLTLAIYTLFIPVSHRIFEERAKKLEGWIARFNALKEKITVDSTDKEIKQLKWLKERINETRILPRYLGIGVAGTFLCFMASTFFSGTWLYTSVNRTPNNEFLMMLFFVIGFVAFGFVSLFIVLEIHTTMKKDFEEIKQKRKETLKQSQKLIEESEKR
jgi:hypothetical protein